MRGFTFISDLHATFILSGVFEGDGEGGREWLGKGAALMEVSEG